MISGRLRFSFFPRCGTFVQRRSEENEIQSHSRQSHSLSKTTFSTSCETVENVPEFCFLPSVAVQKYRSEEKTKNANAPKLADFGAFY